MTAVVELVGRLRTHWRRQGAIDLPSAPVLTSDPVLAPSVFLRLLDPPDWSVGQLVRYRSHETARLYRPPFTCARALAYQLCLAPAEGRATDRFYESLRAMGVEYTQHDVRFQNEQFTVVDFGLLGEGWRVFLDGLEVARIQYLTAAAGEALESCVLSISYLIEPLALQEQQRGSTAELLWETRGSLYRDAVAAGDEDFRYFETRDDLAASIHSADAHYRHACLALETGRPFAAFESLVSCASSVAHLAPGSDERMPWVERLRATTRRAALMTRELNRRSEREVESA